MTENSLTLSYQQQYWDHDYAHDAGPAEQIDLSLAAVTDRTLRDTLEKIIDHPAPEETIVTHGAGLAGIDIEPELIRVAQTLLGRRLNGPWYMRLLVGVEDTYGALSDWLLTHPFIEHRPFPEHDQSKVLFDPLHQAVIDAIRDRLKLSEELPEGPSDDDEDLKTALAVLSNPRRVDLIWDRMLDPALDEIINRTCLLGKDQS